MTTRETLERLIEAAALRVASSSPTSELGIKVREELTALQDALDTQERLTAELTELRGQVVIGEENERTIRERLTHAERRADLHAKRNQEVSDALGQLFGESWHDMGAKVAKLKQRAEALQQWKDAIIDAAVVDWIYTKEHENNPRKAVNDLLCWQQKIALDPAISKEAHDLVQRAEAAEAALAKAKWDVEDAHASKIARQLELEQVQAELTTLRTQHAALVEWAQEELKGLTRCAAPEFFDDGYAAALETILARLRDNK